MPVTMQDVRLCLDADEVDYAAAAELGESALPHLAALAAGGDMVLAAKAIYLAGVIGGPGSAEIIDSAAGGDDPILRIAASVAQRNVAY